MQFFGQKAKETMDESYRIAEDMKSSYTSLLRYFGEDENMPSGDFFATLNRFLESFDAALDAVNKAEQARVRTSIYCSAVSNSHTHVALAILTLDMRSCVHSFIYYL